VPKTLQFYYCIDPNGTNPFPTNATAFVPALNVSFPTVAAASGGMATNGTFSVNQTNLGVINQPITNWPSEAMLWLVWQMTDSTGKAQGLALDNLSFSASVALPLSLTIPASGGKVLIDWPSVQGQMYQLESSTNLVNPAWTPLGSPVTGTGRTMTLTNTMSSHGFRIERFKLLIVDPTWTAATPLVLRS